MKGRNRTNSLYRSQTVYEGEGGAGLGVQKQKKAVPDLPKIPRVKGKQPAAEAPERHRTRRARRSDNSKLQQFSALDDQEASDFEHSSGSQRIRRMSNQLLFNTQPINPRVEKPSESSLAESPLFLRSEKNTGSKNSSDSENRKKNSKDSASSQDSGFDSFIHVAQDSLIDTLTFKTMHSHELTKKALSIMTSVGELSREADHISSNLEVIHSDVTEASNEIVRTIYTAEEVKRQSSAAVEKMEMLTRQIDALGNSRFNLKMAVIEKLINFVAFIYWVVALVWAFVSSPFKRKRKIMSYEYIKRETLREATAFRQEER